MRVSVDGLSPHSFDLGLSGHQRTAFIEAAHASLVAALKSGSTAVLAVPGRNFRLGLSGSSKAIGNVEGYCTRYREDLRNAEAVFPGGPFRVDDEAHLTYASEETEDVPEFKRYNDLDLWGNDLRSGLEDPLLQNLTLEQCEELCKLTTSCFFYTHNGRTNTCFLKDDLGTQKFYQGAVTGQALAPRPAFPGPPTRGPDLVMDPDAAAREGEAVEEWQARIRSLSNALAGSCPAEDRTLERLSQSLVFDVRGSDELAVGTPMTMSWQGNLLEERIPVWLVISSDQPIRFEGSGSIALGPEAPNPFGIQEGQGKHRALVALYARGSGQDGRIAFLPLRSGSLDIEVSLVGYLRQCGEERRYKTFRKSFEIAPDEAEIVLSNAQGMAAYTHEIPLEKFERRILFNRDRFLILNASDETEIIERAGSELIVSPTHRFLAVRHSDRLDVVDVVDGNTVANTFDGDIFWAMGDSVIMVTLSPWAEVNLHSLFGENLSVEEQVTGPSCCSAAPETTHVAVDLENANYSIWGDFGYRIGSLQAHDYAAADNPLNAYGSEEVGSIATYHQILSSIGPVAPSSVEMGFLAPGDFKSTKLSRDKFSGGKSEPSTLENAQIGWFASANIKPIELRSSSLPSRRNSPNKSSVSRSSTNSMQTAENFDDQMNRIGLGLMPMTDGVQLLADHVSYNRLGGGEHMNGLADYDERLARSEKAIGQFVHEASAAGWRYQWGLPEDFDALKLECSHVIFGDTETDEGLVLAPRDIVSLSYVPSEPDHSIWVARAACSAGATFGTLRFYQAIYVMDLAGPKPISKDELMADSAWFSGNSTQPRWFDHDPLIKANDRYLMTYSPGSAAVTIYDRNAKEFVWKRDDLPNGDLLEDAWMTKDGRHVVQLNSDAGFYVHAIEDGDVVLSGRIVDDEVAVWTDDFRFDATAEAASLIDLKFPGHDGQFSLDRFGAALRTPGLAELALYEERLDPAKEVGLPPALSGRIHAGEGDMVLADLDYDLATVSTLNVFQDGLLTDSMAVGDLAEPTQLEFARLKDARWISVIAADGNGLASLPVSADIGATPIPSAVSRALVIGVNTYSDPQIPSLDYALADAGRFAEALDGGLGPSAPVFNSIDYLKDRRATRQAILTRTRALLEGLEMGDNAVFYFAGHGLRDENGVFYLGTSETQLDHLEDTALAFSEVANLIAESEARITVIIDACHSGSAALRSTAANDQIVQDLTALNSNVTILSASKGRQLSQEAGDIGGGVFTVALEQVLSSERERYDLNHNGRIEASELYNGVKDIVVQRQQGAQTPWIARSRMVGDYAVF